MKKMTAAESLLQAAQVVSEIVREYELTKEAR